MATKAELEAALRRIYEQERLLSDDGGGPMALEELLLEIQAARALLSEHAECGGSLTLKDGRWVCLDCGHVSSRETGPQVDPRTAPR